MKNKIVLSLLAITVLGYPIYTATTGLLLRFLIQSDENQLLRRAPYLSIVHKEYREGIYQSDETLTIGLTRVIPAPLATAQTMNPPSFEITIHHVIHHGPFPHLKSLALALIDTELVLPASVTRTLAPVLHGRPPLQMQTRMSLIGGARTTLVSPAFETPAGSPTAVSWRGLTGEFSRGRRLAWFSGTLSSEGLSVHDPNLSFVVNGLRVDADSRRVLNELYAGTSTFSIANLEFTAAAPGPHFALTGLHVRNSTSLAGNFFGGEANMTAESLQASTFAATKVGYAIAVAHLDAVATDAWLSAIHAAPAAPDANAAAKLSADAMSKYGVEILLHDPVLTIQRIGFTMPEGTLDLSGKVTFEGLQREEAVGRMAVFGLLKHLHALLDFQIDEALAAKLSASASKPDMMDAQIKAFEAQGFLTQEGGKLKTHIEFSNGQLRLNGKPFTPNVPARPAAG